MVKVIPARIENGRIIPSEPLPDASAIEAVKVVLTLKESESGPSIERPSVLSELRGILKGKVPESDDALKALYVEDLESLAELEGP